jgi:deoxycytidylate deaminase
MCSLKIIHSLINSIDDLKSSQYHHHYSGIYRNGKRMCTGYNHLRNCYNGNCTCYSTHAEMDVIHKALKNNIELNNCTIAVIRFGRDGLLKNSRPCNHCLDTMKFHRIKKIMYSTDDGTIKTERPEYMEHMHISSGWSAFHNPERLKTSKKIT